MAVPRLARFLAVLAILLARGSGAILAQGGVPAVGTIISNVAQVSFAATDGVPRRPAQTNQVQTIVAPGVGLSVTKEQSRSVVSPGDLLEYRMVVTNRGSTDLSLVTLDDTIPAGLILESTSPGGVAQGGVVRWAVPSIAFGASATFTMSVRVPATATGGTTFRNVAIAAAAGAPTVSSQTVAATVGLQPVLRLSKRVDRSVVSPGETARFSIDWANDGNATAASALISDPLPPGTRLGALTAGGSLVNGQVRFSLGDLAPGSSGTVNFDAELTSAIVEGDVIRNTAGISAAGGFQAFSNEVAVSVFARSINDIQVTADPTVIIANGVDSSLLSARVRFATGQPVPDGTPVTFRTPIGSLAGGGLTQVVPTRGGLAETRLVADFIGTAPLRALATVTAGTPATGLAYAEVEILFAPAAVVGRVLTAAGEGVAGFEARLLELAGQEVGRGTSNTRGSYGIALGRPGSYRVELSGRSPRHGTQVLIRTSVEVPNLGGATFSPAGGIAGRTLDRATGLGLMDASVRLFASTPGAAKIGPPLATSVTDATGRFSFGGLARGNYVIEADSGRPQDLLPPAPRAISLATDGEARVDVDLAADPIGFVFDLATGSLIAGATVTLLESSGGSLVRVGASGGSLPNPIATDSTGHFSFSVPSGRYIVLVTSPGYQSFRSDVLSVTDPTLPLTRVIGLAPEALRINKLASRTVVSPGEILGYQVTLDNVSTAALTEVVVSDTVPAGFSFIAGTALLNGIAIPDPVKKAPLEFKLGGLAPRSSAVLSYRLAVGPGAIRSRGVNSATVSANLGGAILRAGPAQAAVEVVRDVFYEEGILIGQVYADRDGDGRRGPGDDPVSNARVYVEDGTSAFTDSLGQYSIEGVSAQRHVVMLDPASLEGGAGRWVPAGGTKHGWGRLTLGRVGTLTRVDFPLTEVGREAPSAEEPVRPGEFELPSSQVRGESPRPPERESPPEASRVKRTPDKVPALKARAAILDPPDKGIVDQGHVRIRVYVASGLTGQLRVNGIAIPESRVGSRVTDNRTGNRVLTYVGIPLQTGSNKIQLSALDSFGLTRANVASRIFRVGPPDSLRIVEDPESLVADGKRSGQVRIAVLDAQGLPVKDGERVTVSVSGAEALSPDADPSCEGLQLQVRDGTAVLELAPVARAGPFSVMALAGAARAEAKLKTTVDLRKPIVLGVGSLELGHRNTKGSLGGLADTRDLKPGWHDRSRAAFFAKGRVLDDYLLTMALDTAKETRTRLFRDIDTDRYYPLYGDSSRLDRDAQGAGKLYLKLERGDDYLQGGDFQTGFQETELAAYNRRLTGVKAEKHTADWDVTALASSSQQRLVRDLIRGGGNSGPYFLSNSNVLLGSEQISIETRDPRFIEVVRESRTLVRNLDYTLNAFEGTLVFKEPVGYQSPAFEPIFIVARYEVRPGSGGTEQQVLGGRGRLRLGGGVRLGATAVREDDRQEDFGLTGVDASARLGRFDVTGELARTDSRSMGEGTGYRLRAAGSIAKNWKLDGVYRNLGQGYRNLSNAIGDPGEKRYGVTLEGKPWEKTRLLGAYNKRDNSLRGESSSGTSALAVREVRPGWTVSSGVEKLDRALQNGVTIPGGLANPRSFNDRPALSDFPAGTAASGQAWVGRAAVERSAGGRTSLRAEREQPLDGGRSISPAATTLSLRRKLTDAVDLVAASRFEQFGAFDRSLGSLGFETRLADDTFAYTRYMLQSQERGLENFASYGVKTRKQVSPEVGATVSYETSNRIDGEAPSDFQAIGASVAYIPAGERKNAAIRHERRFGSSGFQRLTELGAGYNVAAGHHLSGKLFHSDTGGTVTRDRNLERHEALLAWAFRPAWIDWLDVLTQYRRRGEILGLLGLSADTVADIFSVDVHVRPEERLLVDLRHAFKMAEDRTGGGSIGLVTTLDALRLTLQLTHRVDIAVEGRRLDQDSTDQTVEGLGVELGYSMLNAIRIAGGYNFAGFDDPDLAGGAITAEGPVLRLDAKVARF